MEVDTEDDAERKEGVFDGEPCEAGSGEFALFAADGGEEVGFGVAEVINVDGPTGGGLAEAEVKGIVGIGEGGYVEVFWNRVIEFSFCVRFSEREKFHLAERVGDFGDGGDGFAVFTGDVVERNGVERVAEDAGEGDEGDFCVGRDGNVFFR